MPSTGIGRAAALAGQHVPQDWRGPTALLATAIALAVLLPLIRWMYTGIPGTKSQSTDES